mmetsp:Transcript_22073/g.51821  ORF Transcript_22073/g.51821 Transcript_22073/m.51821 type:complete len:265 (-) Transcript_22073:1330-2124(-)
MTNHLDSNSPQSVILIVRKRLGRRNHNGLACVYTHWIQVLHVTDNQAVVPGITHHFVFQLLPSLQALIDDDLRRGGESSSQKHLQVFLVRCKATSQTTQCKRSSNKHRKSNLTGDISCLLEGVCACRLRALLAQTLDAYLEDLAIFRCNNGIDLRAENLHAILLESAIAVKCNCTVQRRLPTECGKQSIRSHLVNYLRYELRCNRDEVNLVSQAPGCLDGRNVGVDQHRLHVLLAQCLDGLAPGVIEFTSLPDCQTTGSQHQDL